MKLVDTFVGWQQEFRVAGACPRAKAVARIQIALSARRFSAQDRLAGVLEGSQLRVWKGSVFGRAADVIEFAGSLRSSGEGSAIEGVFRYSFRTKIQFAGLLIMGVALAFIGVLRGTSGLNPDGGLLYIGGFTSFIALLWIYTSGKLKHLQMDFIMEQLSKAVTA